jgi:hypothetical protein
MLYRHVVRTASALRRTSWLTLMAAGCVILCGCRATDRYAEDNAAFFHARTNPTNHALLLSYPRLMFVDFVKENLHTYNEELAARRDDQIIADCDAGTLMEIVGDSRLSDHDYRAHAALLLLAFYQSEDTVSFVNRIANEPLTPGFSSLFAALVLAYWGDGECKDFLHDVLKQGLRSSSGVEYSYAGLGLLMLDDLPADFRFRDLPNPIFWYLDGRRREPPPAMQTSPTE